MIFLSSHKNCSLFSSGNKLISMFYLLCHIRYLQSVFLLPLYSTRSPVFPRKSHSLSSLDGYLLSREGGGTLPSPPSTREQDREAGQRDGQTSALPSQRKHSVTAIWGLCFCFAFAAQLTFNGNIPSSSFLMGNHWVTLNISRNQKTEQPYSLWSYSFEKHLSFIMVTIYIMLLVFYWGRVPRIGEATKQTSNYSRKGFNSSHLTATFLR